MTVHKAKGLEFPIVILADMTAKLVPFEASRHIDHDKGLAAVRIGGWSPKDLTDWSAQEKERERAEGVRIAYVAATRARDVLVVPAVGDQPFGSDAWLSPLDSSIYPAMEARRHPSSAAGCPPFKKDSVLKRPDEGVAMSNTVAPGSHRISADLPFDVVWWDPAALGLGAEPPFGLRRQELISKDVALEVVAEGTARYIAWRNTRDDARTRAAQPSVQVRTATEWARGEREEGTNAQRPTANSHIEIVTLPTSDTRPSGPRFGTLVHASLAVVPLDADEVTIDRVVAVQARIVAAPPDELAAAQQVVRAVLGHGLLADARRASERGALLRETPTTIVRDGQLIEGTVDLAFETDQGFTVIDFKTDRAEGELQIVYARQVQLYAEAIAEATGKPARAVLMSV
jgi:ATP-dependent exoDNAse (exonuclease V) beta subunit